MRHRIDKNPAASGSTDISKHSFSVILFKQKLELSYSFWRGHICTSQCSTLFATLKSDSDVEIKRPLKGENDLFKVSMASRSPII